MADLLLLSPDSALRHRIQCIACLGGYKPQQVYCYLNSQCPLTKRRQQQVVDEQQQRYIAADNEAYRTCYRYNMDFDGSRSYFLKCGHDNHQAREQLEVDGEFGASCSQTMGHYLYRRQCRHRLG